MVPYGAGLARCLDVTTIRYRVSSSMQVLCCLELSVFIRWQCMNWGCPTLNTMVLVSCLCLVLVHFRLVLQCDLVLISTPWSAHGIQVICGYTHGEFGYI